MLALFTGLNDSDYAIEFEPEYLFVSAVLMIFVVALHDSFLPKGKIRKCFIVFVSTFVSLQNFRDLLCFRLCFLCKDVGIFALQNFRDLPSFRFVTELLFNFCSSV